MFTYNRQVAFGLIAILILQFITVILVLLPEKGVTIVRDRLDTIVTLGFGSPVEDMASCLRSINVYSQQASSSRNCADLDWRIEPGESAPLWAWSGNSRDASVSQPGKSVTFSVVDTDGVVVPVEFASISPNSALTGDNGFLLNLVTFQGIRPGVYRIRAIYPDRGTTAFSYSPNIIVQSQ